MKSKSRSKVGMGTFDYTCSSSTDSDGACIAALGCSGGVMIRVMGYHLKPLKILWRKSSDKVMQVARHKTAGQGPAYLVMTVHTHALLTRNVKHSYIQPSHSSSCLCWRGPTSKGCDCLTIDFEKKYSVVVTTSTNL